MQRLCTFLERECVEGWEVHPRKDLVFEAFRLTPFEKVRVVIVGQDPYRRDDATGLAFSIPPDRNLTRSLHNISRELH